MRVSYHVSALPRVLVLQLKRFEIDTLMLVAAAGAAALGAWAEGALLLLLFSLGHALEHFAMGRAKRAIEALADLAPLLALPDTESQLAFFKKLISGRMSSREAEAGVRKAGGRGAHEFFWDDFKAEIDG